MLFEQNFKNPEDTPALLERIRTYAEQCAGQTGPIQLMEVCGTHTMAIARSGLKTVLPSSVRLLSGPGCPVCVTPAGVMDAILSLTEDPRILVASYGDLLRVPGSRRGDSLLSRRAAGAKIQSVYSPVEALRIARERPELEVVFLGVGFETTAPGTAACVLEAAGENLKNFSVLSLLKKTEPALRSLIEAPDFRVDGFLCPGHVAAVTGSQAFSFLPREYGLPAVVAGFEAADLLAAVLELTRMLAHRQPDLVNEYTRLVKPQGNLAARKLMDKVLRPAPACWRGLGYIEGSGLLPREEYSRWDAWKKFSLSFPPASSLAEEPPGCRCGQIIRGVMEPVECPLFGGLCTPENPVGPCMVSGEGSCAAAYQYGERQ